MWGQIEIYALVHSPVIAPLSPGPIVVPEREEVSAMALDMTCTPAIRGEIVRQRQAAILEALEAGLLANEAAGRSARAIARSEAGMKRGPSHQHWPSRLVHVH
jgi:hypothetical protein